jgi:hypothetical protein
MNLPVNTVPDGFRDLVAPLPLVAAQIISRSITSGSDTRISFFVAIFRL